MVTGSRIDRRIFIVGVPRSGTTLVQSLLAAHSAVTSFTESHFFSRHFAVLPRSSSVVLTRDPTERLRDFLAENRVEPRAAIAMEDRVRSTMPARFLLPLRTRRVARELLGVLDELALLEGVSNWVEKTPRHLRYVPFLERLYGGSQRPRFVHVIREGLETVASLYTASQNWERSYDLETCVERWNSDVRFSLARASEPTDHFVFYEELTARPEATLKRLIEKLGLDWQPRMFDRYAKESARLITGEESWKANVSGRVRRSGTSGRALTEDQRARAHEMLCRDLYESLLERGS